MTAGLASQYTSHLFESYLSNAEIRQLHIYQDSGETRRALLEYIEFGYNRKGIHRAIDYMTLPQKEDMELDKVDSGYGIMIRY